MIRETNRLDSSVFQFIVFSFFENFFSMNFVFLKDVAVIFQSNFVETRKILVGSTSLMSSLAFRFLRSFNLFSH